MLILRLGNYLKKKFLPIFFLICRVVITSEVANVFMYLLTIHVFFLLWSACWCFLPNFFIMVAPFILFCENSLRSQSVISLLVTNPGRVFWWQGDNLPGKRISRAQYDQEKKEPQVQQFLVLHRPDAVPYRLWGIGYRKEGALLVNISMLCYMSSRCTWEKTSSHCCVVGTFKNNKELYTSTFWWRWSKRELALQSTYVVLGHL